MLIKIMKIKFYSSIFFIPGITRVFSNQPSPFVKCFLFPALFPGLAAILMIFARLYQAC